jgi:heptosyltransferase-2
MKLAVFLPGWIGDVVMATPAIRALREQYPDAEVTGVAKPYVAGVVTGSPWFDEMLLGTSVLRLARQLRRRRIDLAVLFPNSFRTALIAWLGGCRRRVGHGRYFRSWLLTDTLPVPPGPSPVLDAYNALAMRAGCADPGRRMELFTTAEDEAAAERVWQAARFQGAEVIGLNPGAAFGAAKCWPTEHWVELATTLVRQRGCRVLVLGGPAERALTQEIARACRLPWVVAVPDVTAALSLGLSKALVRRLDLLVTTDSGPRHFAAAFGRPVVTLFGPTHIAWTETYHPCAIHLQKVLPCGPCQRRVCPLKHHRCMTELEPAKVAAACANLLPPARRQSG